MRDLHELFVHELKDMYDAETRLVGALGKIAKESDDPEVRQAFRDHRDETRGHVERLRKVFKAVGKPARKEPCAGVIGILKEREATKRALKPPAPVLDAISLSGAMKVERYEMTAYESLLDLAERLDLGDRVRGPLEENLLEERAAFDVAQSLAAEIDPVGALAQASREPSRRTRAGGRASGRRPVAARSRR